MHPWARISSAGLSLVVSWGALARGAAGEGAPAREEAATVALEGHRAEPRDPVERPVRRPTGRSTALPLEGVGGEELAATERTCTAPPIGESEACAAFALAPGESVEIDLKESKDAGGSNQTDQIHFRVYDIKSKTNVDEFPLTVGGRYTLKNNNSSSFDLVVYVKGSSLATTRNIRFTYEKKK